MAYYPLSMGKSRLGNANRQFVFPRAALYRAVTHSFCGRVREGDRPGYGFSYSERHLQCVWFDGSYRPVVLRTREGAEVTVESPGRWNLEAGPDFLDAVLVIGPERRRVAGDVEIHINPADWRRHDHRSDSRYSRVVAHVSYFRGASQKMHLPTGAVEISLEDDLKADRFFSFESVDTSAYPYAERRSPTPCGQALAGRSVECAATLLESAGEERIRSKAERMGHLIEQYGQEQVLYEEVMCALGYKNNRAPFRALARRVPVNELRGESAGDPGAALALLLGVSALLPARQLENWDRETRAYVRKLWDVWWKRQAAWESRILPPASWSLAGLRPQNHPIRRMAAAASLFCGKTPFHERVLSAGALPAAQWVSLVMDSLSRDAGDQYWDRRLTFAGRRLEKIVSLIGEERAAAILVNVIVPFVAASNQLIPSTGCWPGDLLPPAHDDGVARRMASVLFGRDHNPKFYRTGLRQQGLQQICHDFCENDRTACRECALPAVIAGMPG
ncbi:MAG: DUF2851 family protein [bacterium]